MTDIGRAALDLAIAAEELREQDAASLNWEGGSGKPGRHVFIVPVVVTEAYGGSVDWEYFPDN
jgi:hypothetical protein